MSKLELKSAQIQLVIAFGGVDYPMEKPKLGIVAEMEERLEYARAEGKGIVRILLEFVVRCGLPKEVASQLDGDELAEVLGFLTPSKKN